MSADELGPWTHPLCDGCWTKAEGDRQPHRLRQPDPEMCCGCGQPTYSGIYQRAEPGSFPHCPAPVTA